MTEDPSFLHAPVGKPQKPFCRRRPCVTTGSVFFFWWLFATCPPVGVASRTFPAPCVAMLRVPHSVSPCPIQSQRLPLTCPAVPFVFTSYAPRSGCTSTAEQHTTPRGKGETCDFMAFAHPHYEEIAYDLSRYLYTLGKSVAKYGEVRRQFSRYCTMYIILGILIVCVAFVSLC